MNRRTTIALLIAILLLAAGLRVGRFFEERTGPLALAPVLDEGTYDRWAQRIAKGTQPDEVPYQASGQAQHLAFWHSLLPERSARDAARLVGVLLGVGSVALTFLIGLWVGNARIGLISAFVVATFRPLIHIEPTLMRDGPATFCTLVVLVLLLWSLKARAVRQGLIRGALLGVALGVGSLVRENLLLLGGAAVLGLVFSARSDRRRPRLACAAALALAQALILAPGVAANHRREGFLSPLPTWNGGCVFYIHNRKENLGSGYQAPAFIDRSNADREAEGFWREAERREGRSLQPHEVSSYWLRQGLADVRAEPLLYALRIYARTRNFLISDEIPQARDLVADRAASRVLRFPSAGFGLFAALGLLGLLIVRRNPGGVTVGLATVAFAATVVPVAFVTRYRLPAVPGTVVLGVLALSLVTRSARRLWWLTGSSEAPSRAQLAAVLSTRGRDLRRVLLGALALAVGLGLHAYDAEYSPRGNQINRAVSFLSLGRYEEAATELEGLVGEKGFVELELLGRARLKAAEAGGPRAEAHVRRARAVYAQAVRLDPERPQGWAGLALTQFLLGEREEALEAIRKARALEPEQAGYEQLERKILAR